MVGKRKERRIYPGKVTGAGTRKASIRIGAIPLSEVISLSVAGIKPVTAIEGPTSIKLTVNGREHVVIVEPNWPLRDVLRENLGLTSIKDFCSGYGACGSCTVIMDGRPVLSCSVLAIDCDGSIIETAEGIAAANHPLIESFIMNWAAQCGYCVPGFLVTAKALLDHNPNPTVEEIKEALSGNLCRCGNYAAQIKAVLDAAVNLNRKN